MGCIMKCMKNIVNAARYTWMRRKAGAHGTACRCEQITPAAFFHCGYVCLPSREAFFVLRRRAPAFLASLPGVMDAIDDRALTRAFAESMLAGYLDGLLPPSFWAKRGKKADFQKAGGTAK